MPALDFGACAAELAPEPPFVPRADPAALEGKLELGQTHVVDVRELGLLDGEECASRPTFRGPQGPDGADFGAESHVGADATFGAGGCSRVHAKLTSGRETLLLFTPAAHISEEATRVLVSATTAGGDALGTLALLPPSEPLPLFEQKFVVQPRQVRRDGRAARRVADGDPGAVGSQGRRSPSA